MTSTAILKLSLGKMCIVFFTMLIELQAYRKLKQRFFTQLFELVVLNGDLITQIVIVVMTSTHITSKIYSIEW